MAKKNFDNFVNAAGKRKKPSPEEVDELSKIIHPAEAAAVQPTPAAVQAPAKLEVEKLEKAEPLQPKTPTPRRKKTPRGKVGKRNLDAPPSEKVRITVDLAKDLYKRMKIQLVEEEIDISSYVRDLIERDLSRK